MSAFLPGANSSSPGSSRTPDLSMAGGTARGRGDTHRILQAGQGDEVIVNRIQVGLLGACEGTLGVGNLGRRCIPHVGPGAYQPVILLRLDHGGAGPVDRQASGNQVAIGLGNLEGDGIRDGLRLGNGRSDLRVGNAKFSYTLAAFKQAPFEFDAAHSQVGVSSWGRLL